MQAALAALAETLKAALAELGHDRPDCLVNNAGDGV